MSQNLGSVYKRGRIWWVTYNVDGTQHRESSHGTRKGDANRLLAQRIAEISDGRFVGPANDRMGWDEFEGMVRDHYAPKRSRERAEGALKHLRGQLRHRRVKSITLDVLTRYRNQRFEEGAAPSTVKYELAVLRKGLNLAVRSGKLLRCPPMPEITVENTRVGFFEESELQALLRELPDYLCGVFEGAYLMGWRVYSELLPLRWSQVDLDAGWVRLEPGTTKNGKGRMFPFNLYARLKTVFERQREYTDQIQRQQGSVIPYVFHHNGRPIRDFRHAWKVACRKAGLIGKIPHDFRRTAVRNLERAGVSRSVAMQLVGHETETIYQRYAITTERDLAEGVVKLAALGAGKETTTVTPIRSAGSG